MPPVKNLSAREKREIVATQGTDENIALIRERFGIRTRLYRIWQEAGKMDPKHSAPEQEEHQEHQEEDPFFELFGYLRQDVHAISQHLKIIAAHLPRKDGVEEKEATILESIENNCNAAIRAGNAATSVLYLLVQAAALFGFGFLFLLAAKKINAK